MTQSPLARLPQLGQSVWYDYIRRDLMTSGTLARYIAEDDLRGMTSNPTIFAQAIQKSDLYDGDIRAAPADQGEAALFEELEVREIQVAADAFRPVFDRTGGGDGHVSIEVAPTLARDTAATIEEARRLWASCDRENVMIKIPGTKEGLPAIETCLYEGININVTLLFAVERYEEVMETWLRALERRVADGLPVDGVTSVASFFVSRVDGLVDKLVKAKLGTLAGADEKRLASVRQKSGIANARLAYAAYETKIARSDRFRALQKRGAKVQRPLWASTSTKDPSLPADYYVEALIGPDTVNTMPPQTYDAYRKDGDPAVRIRDDLDDARASMETLAAFDVDFAAATRQLEDEGVGKFAESYDELLDSIATKRQQIGAT